MIDIGTRTIPRIGLGCWPIGGPFHREGTPLGYGKVDDAESIRAIHAGHDAGLRLFDTADVYGAGHSEEVLARALKGRDAVISTKFGNLFDPATKELTGTSADPAYVRRAVEASLRRLGRERVDIVFLHTNELPVAEARPLFDALKSLRAEGKIGGYGWSTDAVDSARAGAEQTGFTAVQYKMNLVRPAPEMTDFIDERGLLGFIRSPLAMGILTGRFDRPRELRNDIRGSNMVWMDQFIDGRPTEEVAARFNAVRELMRTGGRTLAQGALGWLLAMSPRTVPIPGFRTVAQVEDLAGAVGHGPLPEPVMAEIAEILAGEFV
ncbi:MAG: aldo/keto reductase [Pseudomonadota bacterium]